MALDISHPLPSTIVCDIDTGWAINYPAEWQHPESGWWRDDETAQRIVLTRIEMGIELQDALHAYVAGLQEPSPDGNHYRFDYATQRYARV